MFRSIITRFTVLLAYLTGRRNVVRAAIVTTMTAAPVAVYAGTSMAATTDPLNGAGDSLVTSLLDDFTTYVIPSVVTILVAVLAFKLIVKMATRFLNRA